MRSTWWTRCWWLVTALLAALALAPASAFAQAPFPIVYVRCPRHEDPITISGTVTVGGVPVMRSRVLQGADVYDTLPDVTNFYGGFTAPCDLVYRDTSGAERVLFDCASGSTDAAACAAMDPAVSFDARTVAFTVFRGRLTHKTEDYPAVLLDFATTDTNFRRVALPNVELETTEAQLYLVDVATGRLTALPHTAGVYDTGPAWTSEGRLAFTSTRAGDQHTLIWTTNSFRTASQLYAMDLDGRNVERISAHALGSEQHPFQLMDGRLAFNSWQIFGALPFRTTNGNPGGPGTTNNMFHLFAEDTDGAGLFALWGQHTVNSGGGGPLCGGSACPTHNAAHFVTQSSDGRVWTADYYRGNNNGMGLVEGFVISPDGQEGIGPGEHPAVHDVYRPRQFALLSTWAANGDFFAGPMPTPAMSIPTYRDPLALSGRLTHPAGVPGNQVMVTWGVGGCSTEVGPSVAPLLPTPTPPLTSGGGQLVPVNTLSLIGRDNPGCDAGIYVTTRIPSTHPSDLTLIVNSRRYHEFMARPVVPYRAIYGMDTPRVRPRAAVASAGEPALPGGTPFGVLGAASILLRETRSVVGLPFLSEVTWGLQGTDTVDYADAELCGVRILAVQPNRTGDNLRLLTRAGERVVVLGEVPVRNYRPDGTPVMDAMGMPDTSFRVRIPADTPYLMQGIDCDGRTLNTDQTWQSLRPGEQKTCGGCHLHSRPGLDFNTTFAALRTYQPRPLGEGTVPLLAGGSGASVRTRTVDGYGAAFEFARDVMPILQRRCASCHSGASAAAGLQLDVPGTQGPSTMAGAPPASTWWRLVADRGQQTVPAALKYAVQGQTGGYQYIFRLPQMTRYVRFMNARGSLLYWKAANARTDNRTDAQFGPSSPTGSYDIDFGAAHPVPGITPEELGTISRWIDTGCGAGAPFLADTARPALNVAPVIESGAVAGVLVGSVDVGSGIDPMSLEVCVIDRPGAACGPNLATRAEAHGVATVRLASALGDPDAEVRVRVRDLAGNTAEVQRTVRWLLSLPPPVIVPPPDSGDGGVVDDAGNVVLPDGALVARDGAVVGNDGGGGGPVRGVVACSCRVAGGATAPASRGGRAGAVLAIAGACAALLARRRRRRHHCALRGEDGARS